MKIRCYSELKRLNTFEERYKYLRIGGMVGQETFGFDRYLNQRLYRSAEWKRIRNLVLIRDDGCDLGISGREIETKPIIHHMNPITTEDILEGNPDIFNPEFLVCVSYDTHLAIHYGTESMIPKLPTQRSKWDTVPWRT